MKQRSKSAAPALAFLNCGLERAAGLCLAAAVLCAVDPAAAQMKPSTADIAVEAIRVDARPIASFDKSGAPFVDRRLAWRGGLVLTSPSPYFGGWSGLVLDADGERFVAVSDSGVWLTGALTYDAGRLSGIAGARLGPFRTKKGGPLTRMRDRDAEAITLASGTASKGTAYIAFEQADRIGVFDIGKSGLGTPSSYLTMPKEAARMRLNGIEALAILAGGPRKGALVAFAENPLKGETVHRGWIWTGAAPRGFTVPGLGTYSITDAASLADGSVLILERQFRWFEGLRIRLRHLPAGSLKPGAAVRGEVLLQADTAKEIDNLEAMAVSRGADGETVVTLMSDDNFNRFLQRTVMLQFTLKDEPELEDETAAAKP
jgi:hypothetical protein